MQPDRTRAFAWIVVTYVVALIAAVIAWRMLPDQHPLMRGAIADVVATAVVFGFSVAFNNSSFYDAYWSVAPPFLLLGWISREGNTPRIALVAVLVTAWAVRLTWNWARGWTGLHHEDWRYVKIRNDTRALYWPVSFLGIHLMPTVMVFLGSTGLFASGRSSVPLGGLDVIAAPLTAFAIWLEATADAQLRAFVLSKPPREAVMASGVWQWSRHPNYCGEVLFWWGVGLFGVAAAGLQWWILLGPVAITSLFLFVSIPLIEKRMVASRPAFAERQKNVSALFLWWPRNASRFSRAIWTLLVCGLVLSICMAVYAHDRPYALIQGACVAFLFATCAMALNRGPSPFVILGLIVGWALLDFPLTATIAGREDQRHLYMLILFGGPAASVVALVVARRPPRPEMGSAEWNRRELYEGALVGLAVVHLLVLGLFGPVQLGDNFRARQMRAVSDVTHLAQALKRVRTDTGNQSPTCLDLNHLRLAHSPAECGALPNCPERPQDDPLAPCWGGPYLPGVSNDPWTGTYRVRVGPAGLVRVTSSGGDRLENTEDDVSSPEQ